MRSPTTSEEVISEAVLRHIDKSWEGLESTIAMIPGKDALSAFNADLQKAYGVTVTPTSIVDAMQVDEVPDEMSKLVSALSNFSKMRIKAAQRPEG